MNESTFSAYVTKKFRDAGYMVQRIETTTGSGVPDLCILGNNKTYWVELKYRTPVLRPAQYAWHKKAQEKGILVLTLFLPKDSDDVHVFHLADSEIKLIKNGVRLSNPSSVFKKKHITDCLMNEFVCTST